MSLPDAAGLPSRQNWFDREDYPTSSSEEMSLSFSHNNSSSHVGLKHALLIIKRMTAPQLVRTMCVLLQTKIKAFMPKSSSTQTTFPCNMTDMIRLYRPHSKPIYCKPTYWKYAVEAATASVPPSRACISTLNLATWWRRYWHKAKRVIWTTHVTHAPNNFIKRGSAA